ncbi:MAG: beta-ketoacyl-[acyl-carrier-protein] synthase family protein [Candidatus Aminicenantes bacterium]|nr:beta-ketoacyl-[acyl-carrier-protein] synthase family protein [Candidatus Aminicenantes bacterium]
MSEVYLLTGAAVTAANPRGEDLLGALLDGKEFPLEVKRFDTSRLAFHRAACVEGLEAERKGPENLTQTLLRRLFPLLKGLPPADTVVWAGIKGNAEFIEGGAWRGDSAGAPPFLPRHYSLWVREALGWEEAEVMEIGAACASSTVGFALAADMILSGRRRAVLVAASDIVSRFSFLGFSSLLALTAGVCRPFDARRDGLMLGDGAVLALLVGEEYLREAGRTPQALISGWGVTNDAFHITAPAPRGEGLIAAVKAALDRAGLAPEDIGAMCAHGTGTVYNDAMELRAIESVFGERPLPVFSIKGCVGHTFGAAGGIEALLCARALAAGTVPRTHGFEQPDQGAAGRVSGEARAFEGGRILTTNSGFGGVNAALVMERVR